MSLDVTACYGKEKPPGGHPIDSDIVILIALISPWWRYGWLKSNLNIQSHPISLITPELSYRRDTEQTYVFWTMISCPILTITGVSLSRRPRTNSKLVIGTFVGFYSTHFYIWWDHKKYNKKESTVLSIFESLIARDWSKIKDSVKPQPNNSKSPSSFVSLTCSNVSFHRFSITQECWVIIYNSFVKRQ